MIGEVKREMGDGAKSWRGREKGERGEAKMEADGLE